MCFLFGVILHCDTVKSWCFFLGMFCFGEDFVTVTQLNVKCLGYMGSIWYGNIWEYMGMGWNNEITFCLGVENPFLSPTNRLCSSRPVNSFAKTSNLNDFEVRMFSTYFKFSFDVQRRRHSQNRPVRRRQCGKSLRFHVSECLVRQLLLKHRCESGLSAKLKRLVCRLANGTRIRH